MGHPRCVIQCTEEVKKVKDYLVKTHSIDRKVWDSGNVLSWLVMLRCQDLVGVIAIGCGFMIVVPNATSTTVPVWMFNSKEQPDTFRSQMIVVLHAKPFAKINIYKVPPTMHHRWVGTRVIGPKTNFGDDEIIESKYCCRTMSISERQSSVSTLNQCKMNTKGATSNERQYQCRQVTFIFFHTTPAQYRKLLMHDDHK